MTSKAKKIIAVVAVIVVLCAILAAGIFTLNSSTKADTLTIQEAESFVNEKTDEMAITNTLKFVADKNYITVKSLDYGNEKDIILQCTVKTIDVYSAVKPEYDSFMSADVKKPNSTMFKSALDFKLEFEESIVTLLGQAQEKETDCAIYLYQTNEGITLYASDETVNAVYGGIIDVINESSEITTYKLVDGTEKEILSKNVNKGFAECFKTRRNANKPDTSTPLIRWWNGLKDDFHKNFIEKDRWHTILTGLWTTIKLTICALLIGIVLGFLVAFVRCTYLKTAKKGIILKLLNSLCQIYLTVIRGTPVVVQIMIIYFVVFMPMGVDKFLSAVICFGLNSGAYVAEIVRGGIMSIDDGQSEAGRSLGFGYMQTMWLIVFPQAFKAVLPALANEFVVLLKETSIAFYIGLGDLMYAGNAIRAATYSAFMPLIAVAVIYFIMVLALSKLVSLLERRLRKNER